MNPATGIGFFWRRNVVSALPEAASCLHFEASVTGSLHHIVGPANSETGYKWTQTLNPKGPKECIINIPRISK